MQTSRSFEPSQALQFLAVVLTSASILWTAIGQLRSSERADLQLVGPPAGATWLGLGLSITVIVAAFLLSDRFLHWPFLVLGLVLGSLSGVFLRLMTMWTEDANIGGGFALLCMPVILILIALLAAAAGVYAK